MVSITRRSRSNPIAYIILIGHYITSHTVQCWLALGNSGGGGLFEQDRDQVLVLNHTNLDFYLNTTRSHSVILFYSAMCGHCQRFKQPYADAAIEMKEMRKHVVFGVVNCLGANHQLCIEKKINAYPTVLFYTPGKQGDPQRLSRLQVSPTTPKIVSRVSEAVFGGANKSDIAFKTFTEQYSSMKRGSDGMLTLFEKNEDTDLTNNLIMYSTVFHKVKFSRILATKSDTMLEIESFLKGNLKSQSFKFPLLVYSFYDPFQQKTISELVHDGNDEPKLFYASMKITLADSLRTGPTLNEIFSTGLSKSELDIAVHAIKDQEVIKVLETRNQESIYMEDLVSAWVYTLDSEVPMGIPFDDSGWEGVRAFLACIGKFFPDVQQSENLYDESQLAMSAIVRNTSIAMLKFLDSKSNDLDLTYKEWSEQLKIVFKNTSRNNKEIWEPKYINCQGSEPSFRGYPCSMWTLFHSLQISAYSKNTSDTSVLTAMVKYITNFFSCADCRENFERETANYKEYLKDGKSAIKYLWRIHNSVNARLSGDITEDPTHKKVQYPTFKQCPECYFKAPKIPDEPKDLIWNEGKVVLYLKKFYSANNIRFFSGKQTMSTKRKVKPGETVKAIAEQIGAKNLGNQKMVVDTQTTSFFSRTDIFLLLLTYICSMLCITALCCYLQRKKLHKCRNAGAKPRHSLA